MLKKQCLAQCCLSKEAVSISIQWLKPECFYKESHSIIFTAMESLFNQGEPVDTLSVVNLLKKIKKLNSWRSLFY